MNNLNWEEKYEFLKIMCPGLAIQMRKPGDWYCSGPCGIADVSIETGAYGNGDSPKAAVEDMFEIYSAVTYDNFISEPKETKKYIHSYGGGGSRYFFYSKYGWKEITEKELKAWFR